MNTTNDPGQLRLLVEPFPMPVGGELRAAFRDLFLAAEGTEEHKRAIGDPSGLPRPWEPPAPSLSFELSCGPGSMRWSAGRTASARGTPPGSSRPAGLTTPTWCETSQSWPIYAAAPNWP